MKFSFKLVTFSKSYAKNTVDVFFWTQCTKYTFSSGNQWYACLSLQQQSLIIYYPLKVTTGRRVLFFGHDICGSVCGFLWVHLPKWFDVQQARHFKFISRQTSQWKINWPHNVEMQMGDYDWPLCKISCRSVYILVYMLAWNPNQTNKQSTKLYTLLYYFFGTQCIYRHSW